MRDLKSGSRYFMPDHGSPAYSGHPTVDVFGQDTTWDRGFGDGYVRDSADRPREGHDAFSPLYQIYCRNEPWISGSEDWSYMYVNNVFNMPYDEYGLCTDAYELVAHV